MTDKERDLGRVISVSILLLILLVAMFSSCTPMLYNNNRVMVTHVLALTEMGDTVKIRIQDIQPQRMYNVVGYDFVRWQDTRYYTPYYDRHYDYRYYDSKWRYHGSPKGNYGYITPNPNVNNSPPISIGGSQTTGGGNAPVASNPVTSTGGGKKFN